MQKNQNKLGFGFMRLPMTNPKDQTSVDMAMLEEMVDTFLAQGFTYFDTAYMYHAFKSEIALREALVKRHPREAFTVATKLPTMFLKADGDQERIFAEQLEKCGVDYFDYYLLHNLGVGHYEVVKKFDSFGFIQQKKAEGKIRNIGFSYHDNAELLDTILAEHPEVDFVQLQLNYLDWDDQGIQSRRCYEVARKHGVPVIVMEPIKGGTLAKVPAEAESLFRSRRPEMSVASWAVRFAASHDNVMMVLSGMSDTEQLLDNVGYMRDFQPLDTEERAIVREAVALIKASTPIGCTACRYCVDGCPMNIAIPEYFALYNAEKQALNGLFSTQRVYYDNCIRTYGRASECIECRACEASCPQHLPIVEHLKDVAATFEVPLAMG